MGHLGFLAHQPIRIIARLMSKIDWRFSNRVTVNVILHELMNTSARLMSKLDWCFSNWDGLW